MANTKHIEDREARKEAKRRQRRALKQLFDQLPSKDKKKFRDSEIDGLRKWIAEEKG